MLPKAFYLLAKSNLDLEQVAEEEKEGESGTGWEVKNLDKDDGEFDSLSLSFVRSTRASDYTDDFRLYLQSCESFKSPKTVSDFNMPSKLRSTSGETPSMSLDVTNWESVVKPRRGIS